MANHTRDYTITDPSDSLYDGGLNHPVLNERFEWRIRGMTEDGKRLHRRIRRESQEMESRHAREIREHVERERPLREQNDREVKARLAREAAE
jgi:hypothetical protein